ncbi:hypothetical protein RB195_021550 [Necator americanus]|uniref:Uncharacterized protein n=1 Tax=Necator americanus TaxID=51031 RepID=A0ABR1EBW4_NECAM
MSGRAFTTHNKRQANDRLRTKESHLGRRRRGIDADGGEPKTSDARRFRRYVPTDSRTLLMDATILRDEKRTA